MTMTMAPALSLLLAACIALSIKNSGLVRSGVLLYYAAWHMPFILNWILPYSTPLTKEIEPWHIYLWLVSLHVIVLPAVLLNRGMPPVKSQTTEAPHPEFVLLACIGVLFLAVEMVFIKGINVSLTANLLENRELATGPGSMFGQLGFLAAGFALYILLWAFYRDDEGCVRVRPYCVVPFGLSTLIILLSGNRQFLIVGVLLLGLTITYVRDTQLTSSFLRMLVIAVPLSLGLLLFGMERQSQTQGRQDLFLQAISGIKVDDPRSPLADDYRTRASSMYLFLYYGTEHEALSATFQSVEPQAPPLSMTAPIVYRRFSSFLGLPSQDDVRSNGHNQLEERYNVFPRVWTSMYGNVFLEWGIPGVFVYIGLLSFAHHRFVRHLSTVSDARAARTLTIFYAGLAFGVMFIPTYEVAFFGLIIAAFASSFITGLRQAKEATSRYTARQLDFFGQTHS